ncbi:hypothetical protein CERSUDRAFT_120233 [Gelatoporia subvermispora B]|uniref:Major facilitator superfamily (MFS) profile domain-containing protein n=1 Tax=Ceriporiopsis subvermispora (strain B) TaxID=914234 RepID=M2Q2F4_CERS8|nr:hypothetical protein CERSUDRAFT_120233 [Gelatoporia subvermispora B]
MSTVLPTVAPQARDVQSNDSEKGGLSPTISIASLRPPIELGTRRPFWRRPKQGLDSIATQASVFDVPETLEVYRPGPAYENAHRFDPDARWTWREEYAIVRKIDWRVMVWAFIMFFALDLDRLNISQANTDDFLQDLHMTTNDFNLGNSLFRLCFLIAELPSQLVSKRIGPDIWIPSQMVLWSLVSGGQYWLSGRASFLATRCLLGLMQGGFIPDVILYMSYYYTKTELPIRLAWFWVSNYMATLVGAFLATGILQLRQVTGRAGWRYLFLIEGVLTLLVGVASFFMMPPGPTQTKAWYRPNGWFNEREETIIVNRVLRDDPSKSDMHNRQGLTPKMMWSILKDWRMWPLYVLGLTFMIPVTPPQTYLTLLLRDLGFNTVQSNLLTVPSTVLGIVLLLVVSYISEIWDSRIGVIVVLQIWALPLLIALYTFNEHTSQWVYFVVITLITGFPDTHPIQVAWASTNSNSVGTRTVSASMYNMFVQTGSIVSSYVYRANDAPLYKRGNRALIGITVLNIVLYLFTYFFYREINTRRDSIWKSWSPQEQKRYLDTTTDKGSKKINFRFAY